MFDTVLIANRGEIACRVIQTLRRLGLRSVAVYSDADAGARHVRLADEAVRLGPAAASASYLNMDAVLDAARRTGAQAIHPGYGFLSENATFARACEATGIVFIGPDSSAIDTMGDKITAKHAVERRGVPTVPGVARAGMTDEELAGAAADVGYPLLIKPSAGGGGKGMHVVEREPDLRDALRAARREAAASFGDDTLFLERYLLSPRHIEVQVLADAHGNVVHLGERECSLQRRHQKVIEEAPSPLLDAETRARIGEAACETARSVDYRGAGTVEFIVSADRPEEFFFMEMNTRLQVEHPVTEEVTGVDLVEQQVRIAAGEPLTVTQDDIRLAGHSIEARVYAEDPRTGFLPTGGHVVAVHHPTGPGIRVDTALEDGLNVSIDYDPMLAKIIATGADRDEARRRLVAALEETAVFGFATNVEFVRLLLELDDVAEGRLDTGLIAREFDGMRFHQADERAHAEAALLLDAREGAASAGSLWRTARGWRLGPKAPRIYRLSAEGEPVQVAVSGSGAAMTVTVGDGPARRGEVRAFDGRHGVVVIDGQARRFAALVETDAVHATDRAAVHLANRGAVHLADRGAVLTVREERAQHGAAAAVDAAPEVVSPMPGTVVLVHVENGAPVAEGDALMVVEAMKMEHVIRSAIAGRVELRAVQGDEVARGQTLAVVTTEGSEADDD